MPCVVDYELCRLLAFPDQSDTADLAEPLPGVISDPRQGPDRTAVMLACVGVVAMWTGVALWV